MTDEMEVQTQEQNPEEKIESRTAYSEEELYRKWKEWNDDERYDALMYQRLSVQFIKDHLKEINWYALSVNVNLTYDILDEFKSKIKWNALCLSPNNIADGVLYNYAKFIDWPIVCSKQFLDPKLLVALSEKYRKSRSKKARIFWNAVAQYQRLDVDYVDMYRRFLDFKYLSRNGNLEDEVFDKYVKEFDLNVYFKAKQIPEEILKKHAAYINSVRFAETQEQEKGE